MITVEHIDRFFDNPDLIFSSNILHVWTLHDVGPRKIKYIYYFNDYFEIIWFDIHHNGITSQIDKDNKLYDIISLKAIESKLKS